MASFSTATIPFSCLASQDGTSSCSTSGAWVFSSDRQIGRLGLLRQRGRPCPRGDVMFASITSSSAGNNGHTPNPQQVMYNGYQLAPVGVKTGSRVERYVWDGHKLRLVSLESLERGQSASTGLWEFLTRARDEVYHSFFPDVQDVSEDYWPWMRWRLAQRFFSSVMMHNATQSLLVAVGVGAKKAIAASAIINWMLKDGLGRVVRMGVATRYGRSFDSDLKRARFRTSALLTLCMTGEFLTPLFPQHFLLLASISNAGKAVGLTTHVATLPVFHQALCQGANLGDIAAKTQAQHMLMDMLALAVCTTSAYMCRHSPQLRMLVPLLSFPLLGGLDLFCTYKELKGVELKTLNRERCEMIADCWVREQRVPSTAEISEQERLLLAPEWRPLPLEVCSLDTIVTSLDQLHSVLQRSRDQPYLLELGPAGSSQQQQHGGSWLSGLLPAPESKMMACLRSNANTEDIIQLLLHSVLLRKMILQECGSHHSAQPDMTNALACLDEATLSRLCSSSLAEAKEQLPQYLKAASEAGWQIHPFVRSMEERSGLLCFDQDPVAGLSRS